MKKTKLITQLSDWFELRAILKNAKQSIGFVPTMGALHAGHASLLQRARRENDQVVLSVYVNPTQFDSPADLAKYPSTLDADLDLATRAETDFLLSPQYQEIYPDGFRFRISETDFSKTLCGAHRPGHFDGVLTVVMKLLNIVGADRAYFGEKDFQQLLLVRDMAAAFFIETKIVACPTVREHDGLAMSSRNQRLSEKARKLAPLLHEAIKSAMDTSGIRQRLSEAGFEVEYIEEIDKRRLAAAWLDGVRLIDNVER